MASPNERRRNNIRAGAFVTGVLVIALAVIGTVSKFWEHFSLGMEEYTVSYAVAYGVKNLKAGSEVRIGGVSMGHVTEVLADVDGPVFETIHVRFAIDRDVELYSNAKVFVGSPLLGNETWLDISSVGDQAKGRAVQDGDIIEGKVSTGMLSSFLGPVAEGIIDDAAVTLQNAAIASDGAKKFLADLPEQYERHVLPIFNDVQAVTADVKTLTARVKDEDWPRWATSVDQIFARAESLSAALADAAEQGNALMTEARAVVNENRDDIRAAVENSRALTADGSTFVKRLNEETIEKANRLLDNGQEALVAARETIETLRADYDGWAVDIGEFMGNATLASQQLKLATIEVRRSPWKLLYRPSENELQHELLYDAARSFAMATADLKAASRSVQKILDDHGDQLAQDPALLERVRRNLLLPLTKYEEAQARLLETLLVGP